MIPFDFAQANDVGGRADGEGAPKVRTGGPKNFMEELCLPMFRSKYSKSHCSSHSKRKGRADDRFRAVSM